MWRRFSEEERQTIWDMREAGVPVKRIAKHLGRQNVSLRKFIADAGGKRPTARQRSELRLSLEEREEISRGLAAGESIRAIAEALGRCPSTVCREVNANGGTRKYRALVADRAADRRAPLLRRCFSRNSRKDIRGRTSTSQVRLIQRLISSRFPRDRRESRRVPSSSSFAGEFAEESFRARAHFSPPRPSGRGAFVRGCISCRGAGASAPR